MNLEVINDSTPISNFPDIYTRNNGLLAKELANLRGEINSKDASIRELQNAVIGLYETVKGEMIEMFGEAISNLEGEVDSLKQEVATLQNEVTRLKSGNNQ